MSKNITHAQIRNSVQKRLAEDLARKKKMESMVRNDKQDQNIFNKGMAWFDSGLDISDAPEDIRNNTNFIRGFEKGKRVFEANNAVYEEGRNFYFGGASLEQASERMRTNPYFIKGYQDALSLGNSLKGNCK